MEVMVSDDDAYVPGYETGARLILQYVSDERLRPGDRMPTEHGLAEKLGLSRTVVREAIKVLAALGRLEVHKGRGIFVADDASLLGRAPFALFAPDDVSQVSKLFEYRAILEGAAALDASERATPKDRLAMETHAAETHGAAVSGDRDAFGKADFAFHMAVANATGNSFLAASVATVHTLQRHVVTMGLDSNPEEAMLSAADQHEAIARAIGNGQGDVARQLMLDHVAASREASEDAIQRRVFGDPSGRANIA
jgi:DNA-binding FadR family transcriptional regulator